jgi:ribosomal protein L11 methyltransferase
MKYYEVKFHISGPAAMMQDARDILTVMAGEAGFETFEETEEGVTGYVQQALFSQPTLDETLAFFPMDDVKVSYQVAEAEDRDWNEQWEQEGFQPIVIDGLCVVHDGRHIDGLLAEGSLLSIEIDTHLAFGTGTHETTRMMLSALLNLNLEGKRILDCGCGTGILGIAALMAGACEAVGYDIDEWSTDNARHNAVINRVDSRFTSLLGDASLLDSVEGTFDVVLANINRNILLADMPRFARKMNPGSILLLSGFYTTDKPLLTEQAGKLGLTLTAEQTTSDWMCLQFIR